MGLKRTVSTHQPTWCLRMTAKIRLMTHKETLITSHFKLSLQLPHHTHTLFPPNTLGNTELWWEGSRTSEGRGVVKNRDLTESKCRGVHIQALPHARCATWHKSAEFHVTIRMRWRPGAFFDFSEISPGWVLRYKESAYWINPLSYSKPRMFTHKPTKSQEQTWKKSQQEEKKVLDFMWGDENLFRLVVVMFP